MAHGLIYFGSLKGLTRAQVVEKLGIPKPSENTAEDVDLAYDLGAPPDIFSFSFSEALVMRLDSAGRVIDVEIRKGS